MSTFVHNEPTCLPVVQEAGLPEAFYSVVESGLEPVIEVIQAVPNAIGALCLNPTGQNQLAELPNIIPGLFNIFTSERHQRVLQDKENAVLIGTAVEELIRHHPLLKPSVFASIAATMEKIYTMGKNYTPTDDIKQWYILSPVTPSASNEAEVAAVMDVDVEMQPGEASTSQAAPSDPPVDNLPASGPEPTSPNLDDTTPKTHDNTIVSFVDVLCKVSRSRYDLMCRAVLTKFAVSGGLLPAPSSLQGVRRGPGGFGPLWQPDSLALSPL